MFSAENIMDTILHFLVPGMLLFVMLICVLVLWSDRYLRFLSKLTCPASNGCFGLYVHYKRGVTHYWHMNYGWTRDIFKEGVTYLVHAHNVSRKFKRYQYCIIFPDGVVTMIRRDTFNACFTVDKMWPLNYLVQYKQEEKNHD